MKKYGGLKYFQEILWGSEKIQEETRGARNIFWEEYGGIKYFWENIWGRETFWKKYGVRNYFGKNM